MRVLAAIGSLLVLTSAPSAQEDILVRANSCFNVAPSDLGLGAKVEMNLVLDKGLVESIAVTAYAPDTQEGFTIASKAAIAVEQCSPYANLSGQHTLVMDVDNPPNSRSSRITIPLPGTQD